MESHVIKCMCRCGKELEDKDEYDRPRHYINGHNHRKYKNTGQHKREWNHRNREKRYKYKVQYGHKCKIQLIGQLGGKCTNCGLKYNGRNAVLFDFHHIEKSTKLFALSMVTMINRKWEDIKQEAKKCKLLCSNCHRLLHNRGW